MFANALKKHRLLKLAGAAVVTAGLVAGVTLAGVGSDSGVEAKSWKGNKKVKNVIVMISDGWGYNHVKATDYYEGKKQPYEKFPVQLGMSTYEYEGNTPAKQHKLYGINEILGDGTPLHDTGTTSNLLGYDPVLMWEDFSYCAYPFSTDSASAATAMASGVKTYNGAIGVDISGTPVQLVSQAAEAVGKATGVVTSVELSHATPAGFVAHNASRNNYVDIANEMIYSSATDVIMGTGAPDYDNSGYPQDPAGNEKYVGGAATWTDITDDMSVTGADADGDGIADAWTVIRDRADFQAMGDSDTPARVLGIPYVYTTLQQSRDGDATAAPYAVPLIESVPTLEEMTKAALNVLDNDPDGLFLMIEGGAVDWASHANQTGRMIEEQSDFNRAVDTVIKWVERNSNWRETLLIVTGDHETGMLWGPGSGIADDGTAEFAPIKNNGKGNVPGVQWNSGEHTNQLIPLYAKGDQSGQLWSYIRSRDPVRGPYVDNTDLGELIIKVMK